MTTRLLPSQLKGRKLLAPAASIARQRADPRQHAIGVGAPRGVVLVARGERAEAAGQDVLGDEARIDAEQALEAGEQQAGADQQDEGQRDLRDDQRAADHLRGAAGRARAAFLAQHVAQVDARELQRRSGADDDPSRIAGASVTASTTPSRLISCAAADR